MFFSSCIPFSPVDISLLSFLFVHPLKPIAVPIAVPMVSPVHVNRPQSCWIMEKSCRRNPPTPSSFEELVKGTSYRLSSAPCGSAIPRRLTPCSILWPLQGRCRGSGFCTELKVELPVVSTLSEHRRRRRSRHSTPRARTRRTTQQYVNEITHLPLLARLPASLTFSLPRLWSSPPTIAAERNIILFLYYIFIVNRKSSSFGTKINQASHLPPLSRVGNR